MAVVEVIDDRRDRALTMTGKIEAVEQKLKAREK